MIADIQAPDIETRVAILLKKAEHEGLPLGHDVAMFLASKFEANIRELEGSLTRLGALASFLHKPITVEFAREVLKDLVKDRGSQVTVESVQQVISAQFAVKMADLKSPKRTRSSPSPGRWRCTCHASWPELPCPPSARSLAEIIRR